MSQQEVKSWAKLQKLVATNKHRYYCTWHPTQVIDAAFAVSSPYPSSPTNFCGVDLLRLVTLLVRRSINAILSEEGCRNESGINSNSRTSSPADGTNKGNVSFSLLLNVHQHVDGKEIKGGVMCITLSLKWPTLLNNTLSRPHVTI